MGCKSKLTSAQDLIIAEEESAAEAHVAPHGETVSCFDKSPHQANQNSNFGIKRTGKTYKIVLRLH